MAATGLGSIADLDVRSARSCGVRPSGWESGYGALTEAIYPGSEAGVQLKGLTIGAALALGARAALPRLLLAKFTRDLERLNGGDHIALLDAYAEDFVLRFNDGDHRFAGDWVGKAGMDRFLQNFIAARIHGEIKAIATSGPLWALTMWVRFDDNADSPDGTRLYENQTVLVLRTRWGKVVEQEDFFVDTVRLAEFDRKLTKLGIAPIPKSSTPTVDGPGQSAAAG